MSTKTSIHKLKKTVKRPAQNAAKDWALGVAFPQAYAKAARELPVNERKVLFVDVKAGPNEPPDAFDLVMPRMRDRYGMDVRYVGLGQNTSSWTAYYQRCLAFMRDLADARYVFLADASDVTSCVALRPETKIVQLWHACGAFKKFGMSTADKIFGGSRREKERHPFYENLSLVTVSSAEVCWAYREAMVLDQTPDVVQPLGVSRTDVFFDATFLAEARAIVETAVPAISNRKVILYAPTFRGRVLQAESPDEMDLYEMMQQLGDDYVILMKHHPFVKERPVIDERCRQFAFDVTDEMEIEELLCTADICISDYSSLIFEYSLFQKPMIFFAYDLDEYFDHRGFYYDYDEMTPGPIVKDPHELIRAIREIDADFDPAEVIAFREKYMSACDGKATARIIDTICS